MTIYCSFGRCTGAIGQCTGGRSGTVTPQYVLVDDVLILVSDDVLVLVDKALVLKNEGRVFCTRYCCNLMPLLMYEYTGAAKRYTGAVGRYTGAWLALFMFRHMVRVPEILTNEDDELTVCEKWRLSLM